MTVFIYPVLSSQTVNPNILPGIAHSIERYILVNRLDQVMRITRQKYEVDRAGRVHLIEGIRGVAKSEKEIEERRKKEAVIAQQREDKARQALDAVNSRSDLNAKEKQREIDKIWSDFSRDRRNREKEIADDVKQAQKNREDAHKEEIKRLEDIKPATAEEKRKIDEEIENKKQDFAKDQADARKEYEAERDYIDKMWQASWDTIKRARDEAKDRQRAGPAKVDLGRIESGTLSLEPTWVKMETPEGPALVGIKCVPFPVKSDATLAELLLKDRYRSKLEKKIVSTSRKFHRWLFKIFYDKLRGFGMFGRGTLSQHPMKDIIYDRTRFSRTGVFALVNRADLDDDFFKSAGGVSSLFSMGWNTIIVADDVNKQIYFVAKEFRGSYSVVPYPFLYSGINRDAGQVFDTLEDVKKSAAPLFKRRGNIMKLLGEGMADQAINKYKTNITEEHPVITALKESIEPLNEDISDILKNMKGSQVKDKINTIKKSAMKGDIGKIKAVTKFIPKSIANQTVIEKFGKKVMGSDFNKYHKLSKRVLSNSLPKEHPDTAIDIMASLCAITAHNQDNPMKRVQESLKIVVGSIRKHSTKKDTDWELVSAYILAAAALIAFAVPAAALGVGLLNLAGMFPVLAGVILFFVAVTALIWTVRWGPEGDSGPDKLL